MKPRSFRSLVPGAAILAVFAITVAYILVVVPDAAVPTRPAAPAHPPHSDGLSDRHGGYRLEPVALPVERGPAVPVAFRIRSPDGSPAVRYATVQTVPLHLYVVREDLTAYQHLHPRLDGDTWHAAVRVPDGGVYRLYAEFRPATLATARHPVVLGTQFVITGDTAQV